MYVLGINAYHADSGACILKDGNVIFAIEEERLNRVKHWAGFPHLSISECLKFANITLKEISAVAINSNPNNNLFKKLSFIFTHKPSAKLITDRLKNRSRRRDIRTDFKNYFDFDLKKSELYYIDHHLSHLASAQFTSGFNTGLAVSIDGFGDFASSAWGVASENEIDIKGKVFFPHSLGIFYQALTQFIGFKNYGDEYKVMGLAPYGKPTYVDKIQKLIKWNGINYQLNLKYFRHWNNGFEYEWENGIPQIGDLFTSQLGELLSIRPRQESEALSQEHKDIAHSCQIVYEQTLFKFLNSLHNLYPEKNLTLSGGCAMNSVANGKITDNTKFSSIYIPPSAGDAGGAIGAAIVTSKKLGIRTTKLNLANPYLGPCFSNNDIDKIIKQKTKKLNSINCKINSFDDFEILAATVAKYISEGKVVGWFQGGMEWGPRALGNRSILGDPRRSDMKDILNLKIKRRESFRPFAPSILEDCVSDWFEKVDDVPFMMQVFKFLPNKGKIVQAVCHVDGSGRLHTVDKKVNHKYYMLIKKFKEITNVPIVLNTSFNENEPIVCKPEEALDCFLRTSMDVLVLNDRVIIRC